jgi:DNA primase
VPQDPGASRVDVAELKRRVDLLDLIGGDTRLRKVAATAGGEYAGPCPMCGGVDRLRVQPQMGRWWCRQCSSGDRWQDAIGYVMERDNVGFLDAVDILGDRRPVRYRRPPPPPAAPEPNAAWRKRGLAYVAECEQALWSGAGSRARDYLRERGLREETIRRYRLGFQASESSEPGSAWGFDDCDRVQLASGITIPWLADGEVWQVKVRRLSNQPPRYMAVRGSHPLLFGADDCRGVHPAVVLVEGEFDAMLLDQEARRAQVPMPIATLGSCSAKLPNRALRYLLGVGAVFVVYDEDDDGQQGARRLVERSPARLRLEHIPGAHKDLGDFFQAGGRLHDFVAFLLGRLAWEARQHQGPIEEEAAPVVSTGAIHRSGPLAPGEELPW